jgi:hypothetical protein
MPIISERLREYNAWRRGADTEHPHPRELGEAIDCAADRLDVLERESVEHFEKWHAERRAREKLEMEIERLRKLLDEAAGDIMDWGCYASPYFQAKHDLVGCAEKYREAAKEPTK